MRGRKGEKEKKRVTGHKQYNVVSIDMEVVVAAIKGSTTSTSWGCVHTLPLPDPSYNDWLDFVGIDIIVYTCVYNYICEYKYTRVYILLQTEGNIISKPKLCFELKIREQPWECAITAGHTTEYTLPCLYCPHKACSVSEEGVEGLPLSPTSHLYPPLLPPSH